MSWWQLDSVLKEAAQYVAYYKVQPVQSCPFDGTPLRMGPPQSAAVLYCPNGDYYYPADYDEDRDQGM